VNGPNQAPPFKTGLKPIAAPDIRDAAPKATTAYPFFSEHFKRQVELQEKEAPQ
jgi:hypothetical protein